MLVGFPGTSKSTFSTGPHLVFYSFRTHVLILLLWPERDGCLSQGAHTSVEKTGIQGLQQHPAFSVQRDQNFGIGSWVSPETKAPSLGPGSLTPSGSTPAHGMTDLDPVPSIPSGIPPGGRIQGGGAPRKGSPAQGLRTALGVQLGKPAPGEAPIGCRTAVTSAPRRCSPRCLRSVPSC